jgi:FixJ family two-component response regulator
MDATPLQVAPIVRIVDDDVEVRTVLVDLLRSVDVPARAYASSEELFEQDDLESPGCIVLDVNLGSASGLELHASLQGRGNRRPVVFITGEGSVPNSVRAMKNGALDFLLKPFNDREFLDAIEAALTHDRFAANQYQQVRELLDLQNSLTIREREVMTAITDGLLNKQIAAAFGISEVTVKLHRKNLMRKMRASSFADLIRKAELLRSSADLQGVMEE